MSKIKNFKERLLNKWGRNINQTIISQENSTNVKVTQEKRSDSNVQATKDLDVTTNHNEVTIKGDK